MKRNLFQAKTILPILGVLLVLAVAFRYGGEVLPAEPSTQAAAAEAIQTEPAPEAVQDPADESVSQEAPGETSTEAVPESRPGGAQGDMTAQEKKDSAQALVGGTTASQETGNTAWSSLQGMPIDPATGEDPYGTQPVPEGRPVPTEALTCTLTIRCDSILAHMDWLPPEKTSLVPADGFLFPTTTVTFYEGESVFHVLRREMKKAGIHLEFTNAPGYNSAYIEGIGNLYEYDCGELSGWVYRVNDWFPNYGCGRYALQNGDDIQWLYTCDLGLDVGRQVS
ncbi:MAG: DUF4430 domain-containing protein [Ruminiclostridium sp.]|nr:DUF4430 domain-containing protein [Ruminiclostridium sp.]